MSDLIYHEFNPLKILHHIDRLKALAEGDDIAPITVEIDPVAYCNHNCDWCVDPVHDAVTMPEETFTALLEELAKFTVNGFGVQGIVLKGGGEPTLHPSFDLLVRRAVDLGFAVGVVTNGSRLETLADVLAERSAYVRVSVDGPTRESHELIHRSRDFDDVILGVQSLLRSRQERRHPLVGLSFAIDGRTIDLTSQAIWLGERLEVDYVLLRPPFFQEVGRKPTMTASEAAGVRQRLAKAAETYDGPMLVQVGNWVGDAELHVTRPAMTPAGRRDLHRARGLPIEHRIGRCYASPVLAVVTADGQVYGCCNLRALPRWSLGRIDYSNGVGFATIWRSARRKQILGQMHRTECIRHCTHPLARYNDLIEVLRDDQKRHSQFV